MFVVILGLIWKMIFWYGSFYFIDDYVIFCVSGKIDNNNGVSMSNRVLCD